MYEIRFTEVATKDLLDVALYLKEETCDLDFAQKFIQSMRVKIEQKLSIFPNSGIIELINTSVVYRQIIVKGYYIIYRIEETSTSNFVLVTNVIHCRRNKDNIRIGE